MVTKSAEQIALENKIYNLYPIYCKNPIKSRYTELVWLIYELISKYEYKYLKTIIYEGEKQKKIQVMMDAILDKIEEFLKLNLSAKLLSLPQNEFFNYLYSPINQAEALFYRKKTPGLIQLPHKKNELLHQINKIKEYEQSMSKEPLSEEEIMFLITEVYKKCTKNEYYQLKNVISTVNIDTPINDKDGEVLNITDLEVYRQYETAKNAEKAAEAAEEAAELEIEAISAVLSKGNSIECKKALITWHYLTSMKNSYSLLLPVLDRNLVNDYENRRINDQYEVYMRYNPGCTQKEATNNSAKIKERLNKKIEAYKQNKLKKAEKASTMANHKPY